MAWSKNVNVKWVIVGFFAAMFLGALIVRYILVPYPDPII